MIKVVYHWKLYFVCFLSKLLHCLAIGLQQLSPTGKNSSKLIGWRSALIIFQPLFFLRSVADGGHMKIEKWSNLRAEINKFESTRLFETYTDLDCTLDQIEILLTKLINSCWKWVVNCTLFLRPKMYVEKWQQLWAVFAKCWAINRER